MNKPLLPLLALPLLLAQSPPPASQPASYSDDFTHGLDNWSAESQQPATISAKDGILTLDTPAGLTLWFKPLLHAPLQISYDARAIQSNPPGPNDHVTDLNCFFMASDARSPNDLFATHRSGKFSDYNQLLCYYVGLGGNLNTTTRFRRYIGDASDRPLRPEHDLRDKPDLLTPNQWQHIRIVANNHLIQFFRDNKKLFELHDPHPYTTGHVAFRTVHSHFQFKNFQATPLPSSTPPQPQPLDPRPHPPRGNPPPTPNPSHPT
ncbi:MAG: DUF6250 domain-containing protein [Phycisphaerae bacterium]